MSEFELHAWADESMHPATAAGNDGLFLFAAAIGDPTCCDEIRAALRSLVPRGKARLHWHDEDLELRLRIAETIAELDLLNLVVVGAPYDAGKNERARRHCMERLFHELSNCGVSRVTLEARNESLNRKDQQMFAALRGRGQMKGLRAEFDRPMGEPMLWVPDAVAGAVGMDRRRGISGPIEAMGAVEPIDITIS